MSDQNETPEALAAQRDALKAEIARLEVSRATGVPASMLAQATTEEAAHALADQALAWRNDRPPAQPTAAAPSYSTSQFGRNVLPYLGPEGTMEAYRSGKLDQAMGIPPQQLNGSH